MSKTDRERLSLALGLASDRVELLYTLEGDEAVPAENPKAWADWMGSHRKLCVVGRDTPVWGVEVWTTFIGMRQPGPDEGPPFLWETVLFREGAIEDLWRYTSANAARRGHRRVVAMVKKDAEKKQKKEKRKRS